MAYDEELAERIRALVDDQPELTEQEMFGGLAFLVRGHMAVAVSGRGGLMVRADRAEAERLVAAGAAEPMEMRGRPMSGWLHVTTEALRADQDLGRWVRMGTDTVASLPPKRSPGR